MSDLTSAEKKILESLLDMSSGYVLDFSNRSFREFVLDASKIDIYDEKYDYLGNSKAWRLRCFWKIESNSTVGILTEKLLEYWKANKLIAKQVPTIEEESLFRECQKIVNRLKADKPKESYQSSPSPERFFSSQSQLLSEFDTLAELQSTEDRQQRGRLLENLLKRVFDLYEIPTRNGFVRNEGGEQIDGAFKLEGWFYLVECKWTEKLTDIRQLDSLYGKIDRSGKQTLGLFLSIHGWSGHVCPLLKQNCGKSIILMDGDDLRSVLIEYNNLDLKKLLLKKLEHLNLEGEPFLSAAEILEDSAKESAR